VIAVLHLILVYRIRTAHTAAARQRRDDLERFEQLRISTPSREQPISR